MKTKYFCILIIIATLLPLATSAQATYFVRTSANGNGDGSSWDNAMSFSTFEGTSKSNGDVYYFGAGTYTPSSIIVIKDLGYSIIGGFSNALTGTAHETPDYKNLNDDQRTIFDGQSKLNRIVSLNTATVDGDASRKVLLQGLDFTNAYSTSATTTQGALFCRNSGMVEVNHCRFYNNVCDETYGGMAVSSEYSRVVFNDCQFTDNKGVTLGIIALSSDSKTKGYTTFNRCLIANNTVSADKGSAIAFRTGQALTLVNTIITNNTSASGGAVFSNDADATYARTIYIVNSTIAANSGGPQVQYSMTSSGSGANLYVANSIILGTGDATIDVDATKINSFVDGGYNILGTSSPSLGWGDNNLTGQTSCNIFGANAITSGPVAAPYGATADELSKTAENWGLASDYTVDYNNISRSAVSVPGAMVAPAATGSISVTSAGYATYYHSLGWYMPENVEGAVVSSETEGKLTLNYNYSGGDVVPSKKALLLKGPNANYTPFLKLTSESPEPNILYGSDDASTTVSPDGSACYFYKLANDADLGLGFYWAQQNGGAFVSGAHKAYLAIPQRSTSAKSFTLSDDSTLTSIINPAKTGTPMNEVFTLQGFKVDRLTCGVYIVGRKKIIVK